MKESAKNKKRPIEWDRSLPTYQVVEGMRIVGGKCSECSEEWEVGDGLRLPHQFLQRFHEHSRAKHALDPNAHLQYLYKNANARNGTSPTQTTVYQSKNNWEK